MNWWEWIADFTRRARESGDGDRLRLVFLHQQVFAYRERDPQQLVALCGEGTRLAQRLREPWWALWFQHTVVGQFVHFSRDFRRALDLAVAAVLEARKPMYDGCPIRSEIHLDLLAAYFCIDPEGHANAIEAGFREIEGELPDDLNSRLHLINLRRWCMEQSRRVEDHYRAAQRVLAVINDNPGHSASLHYSCFVYGGLCRIHFARGEWQELAEVAALQAQAAQKCGHHKIALAGAYLWQALPALHGGDPARGRRLHLRGLRVLAELGVPPPDGHFEAQSAWHELAGQPLDALAVRDRELALLQAQGRTISEVYCHQERCRLLAEAGGLTPADLEAARAAARRLRFPERHLLALDRLAGG